MALAQIMSGADVVGRVVGVTELAKRLGVSRSTLHRMVKDGNIPEPMKLGTRRIGWRDATIDEWLRSLEAEE